MIRAKIVSITYSESVGGIPKLDLETHLEDPVDINSFCMGVDFDGLDAVIMTKEEYEDMDSVHTVLYKSLLDEREKTEKLRGENDKLKRENNEKEGEICNLIGNNDVEQARLREKIKKLNEENEGIEKASDTLRNSLLDEREKTEQLEETIKRLKEKLAQEAAEVDLCPDGTIVFRKKRVSELEKEVEKLKEENKYLKARLLTRYTVKVDDNGAIIYPESKED